MISIITSSYKKGNFKGLEKNISETIGVDYEVICIENPGLMGICEAYNKGAARARFNALCFVHDDIKFHTQNWGVTLLNILNDNSIGIVGVAGGTYKSKTLSSAWYNGKSYINLIQHSNGKSFHWHEPKENNHGVADVLIVDGVFMGMKKELWEECRFDEQTLKGFHFYDMDICLTVKLKSLRVCVTYDVLLEHFSFGRNDSSWYQEAKKAHKKWRSNLPWSLTKISKKEQTAYEFQALQHSAAEMMDQKGFSRLDKWKTLMRILLVKPSRIKNYKLIKGLLFK